MIQDSAKKLLRELSGLKALADSLDQIVSIEQATSEAQAMLDQRRAELQAAADELDQFRSAASQKQIEMEQAFDARVVEKEAKTAAANTGLKTTTAMLEARTAELANIEDRIAKAKATLADLARGAL